MQQALLDFFASDRFINPVFLMLDKSPQITIETIFRALDLVPTPILVGMNPDSSVIRSNEAGRALFGFENENFSQSATPGDRPNFQVYSDGHLIAPEELPMQRAGLTGLPVEAPECELRFEDGAIKFIRGRAVPVFDRMGLVRGTIGVFIDITKQRDAELLLNIQTEEAKHRAKNSLALVLSVARATVKPQLSPTDYNEFEARLLVISKSLDVFIAQQANQTVEDVVLTTIKEQMGRELERVRFSGPSLAVPFQAITPLSMAIHELTTNAAKYGALSTSRGSVSICWEIAEKSNLLVLRWVERGGPKVVIPLRKGFGSRLISRVLGNPSGKVSEVRFSEEGIECDLYMALGPLG